MAGAFWRTAAEVTFGRCLFDQPVVLEQGVLAQIQSRLKCLSAESVARNFGRAASCGKIPSRGAPRSLKQNDGGEPKKFNEDWHLLDLSFFAHRPLTGLVPPR